MGIGPARADVCCDECGLETEPVELSSGARDGEWLLGDALADLARDGWIVGNDGKLRCDDCAIRRES
jgi:hypothetical protein